MDKHARRRILFVLVPNFSMIAFATAVEPLRLANRFLPEDAYEWCLISEDGAPVTASNGLSLNVDAALSDSRQVCPDQTCATLILVCAGLTVERYRNKGLFSWLRRMHGHGVAVGGLCTGAWVLAEAGLLKNRCCALHWENLPGFSERFPDTEAHSNLFELDGNIYTCAGGTAALDMMLHMICDDLGETIATQVCEQCLADRVRDPRDHQRLPLRTRLGIHNAKLVQIIELMEANLAEPLSLAEISDLAGLSRRHIERLFRQHLGHSPARYYLETRLELARHLLRQSDMHVVEVAMACGFVSASHFSKCYRGYFGASPQADRNATVSLVHA
ncbi:MAG: GlxA family transcriptional regulator [Hyphomicrobiales bacterium]|nr:GlxA family transcriptional regulator [Hyphomicrobiales bacterium]